MGTPLASCVGTGFTFGFGLLLPTGMASAIGCCSLIVSGGCVGNSALSHSLRNVRGTVLRHLHHLRLLLLLLDLLVGLDEAIHVDLASGTCAADVFANDQVLRRYAWAESFEVLQKSSKAIMVVTASDGFDAGRDGGLDHALRQRRKPTLPLHVGHHSDGQWQLQVLGQRGVRPAQGSLKLLRQVPDFFGSD